jgi:hypothetical protein
MSLRAIQRLRQRQDQLVVAGNKDAKDSDSENDDFAGDKPQHASPTVNAFELLMVRGFAF